jgi:hypothetical protein
MENWQRSGSLMAEVFMDKPGLLQTGNEKTQGNRGVVASALAPDVIENMPKIGKKIQPSAATSLLFINHNPPPRHRRSAARPSCR